MVEVVYIWRPFWSGLNLVLGQAAVRISGLPWFFKERGGGPAQCKSIYLFAFPPQIYPNT
jgi:hypothetical protein